MDSLLEYYKPIQNTDGFTLSVDKMAVDYMMAGPDALAALGRLLESLPIRFAVDTRHWTCLKIGSFRENYTVIFQNKNSFWLGVALNSTKTEWKRLRLEFNPNKCAAHASFLAVLAFLNGNSRPIHTAIKRFDFAVDIAVERENVRLIKDGRVYSMREHGKARTEYLGAQASHIGRVKLYNKQAEARLSHPLTRLEVTLDPSTPYEKLPWPKAYYIQCQQVGVDEINITDTERYILTALLAGHGSTKDLCRKTREKMDSLLTQYVRYISIAKTDYDLVQAHLRAFLAYPKNDLGLDRLNLDQPPAPRPTYPAWIKDAEHAPIETPLPQLADVP